MYTVYTHFIGNLEQRIGRNCNIDNTIGNRLIYFSLKIIICRNCPNGKIGYGICELGQVYPSGKAHFLLITNNTHFQLIITITNRNTYYWGRKKQEIVLFS